MGATTTGKPQQALLPLLKLMLTNHAVIYEKGTDFKMDYYLSTHMPLVQEKWAPYGLKSWKVREQSLTCPT